MYFQLSKRENGVLLKNKSLIIIFAFLVVADGALIQFIRTSFLDYGTECTRLIDSENCEKEPNEKLKTVCTEKQEVQLAECIKHPLNVARLVWKILSPYFLGICVIATLVLAYFIIKRSIVKNRI